MSFDSIEAEIAALFDRMENSSRSKRQRREYYVIRIASGGPSSPQEIPVASAVNKLVTRLLRKGTFVKVEARNPAKVHSWGPEAYVDWLLESDLHIISTHIHQGHSLTGHREKWSSLDVVRNLQRLRNHPGFPNGGLLYCPVFLQDKYSYLEALPQITNPTLKITLSRTEAYSLPQVTSFMEAHDEGYGWIIKLPFKTHNEGREFCKTKAEVLENLQKTFTKYASTVPYALLQPTMQNRREFKVVVLNGRAQYVTGQKEGRSGKSFRADCTSYEDLFEFAEAAVRLLARVRPFTISDFILRVDVMQANSGRFVVNEFESFEAFVCDSSSSGKNELDCQQFLHDYWFNVLSKF